MTFNTFNVPSFFAGVATVLALLVVGFGGGVMMSGVLSDTSHKPSKIERQAAKDTEAKPASTPLIPTPVVPAATATESAAAQPKAGQVQSVPETALNAAPATAAASAPPTPQPDPRPAMQTQPAPVQAQAAPQPQTQPSAPLPQTTAQPPSLGPQKSVSLTQTPREQQFDPSQLSRRDQARYWREQRRQERAQRREERRKQFAERPWSEQSRREEMRPAVERMPPRDLDGDDAPRVVPMRPRGLFEGLFGGPRNDDD